jgi:hypothetical protein
MASLCFYDAVMKRRDGEITEDIYLQSIVAHCTGLRHGKNRLCNNDAENGNQEFRFLNFGSNIKTADPSDRFAIKMAFWIFCRFEEAPLNGRHSNTRYGPKH